MGLETLLAQRRDDLYGILNGVDTCQWDPATDPLIPHHYSVDDLSGKRLDKLELQREMKLEPDVTAPTLGIVSRLTAQKGFDLLFDTIPAILEQTNVRLAILGNGARSYVDFFSQLVHRNPGRVSFFEGFSNPLAHRIEAGCDMFLMPSRYEPCGLNQMYSQIYGTVPIVRKTGGLADSVQLFNPATGAGTGIVFDHFNSEGLDWALRFALSLYHQSDLWSRIVHNGMTQDFSWRRSAEQYTRHYRDLFVESRNLLGG